MPLALKFFGDEPSNSDLFTVAGSTEVGQVARGVNPRSQCDIPHQDVVGHPNYDYGMGNSRLAEVNREGLTNLLQKVILIVDQVQSFYQGSKGRTGNKGLRRGRQAGVWRGHWKGWIFGGCRWVVMSVPGIDRCRCAGADGAIAALGGNIQ